ncbi:MAG: hypothetical protein EZS28_007766, partial [Streblomastix strix]
MSPRQSVLIIPAIFEVDSPFEKEIEKQYDQVPVQSERSRRRSSILEIIIPDPSICRWLLNIISEDEHMTKESAHFILSVPQLIRVVAYTFDVVENQVILNTEDEGCCGKFMHDGTRTLRDITINNVNLLTLDIEKVNFLRDSQKLCLQKVRKITSIRDLGDISSKLMPAARKGLMATYTHKMCLQNMMKLYSETLEIIQLAQSNRSEANEIFDRKADKTDIYMKVETDTRLDAKADETDTYSKTETDTLLDDKADKSELIVSYSKSEVDALLLLKEDKTQLIDSYTKTETNNLLNNNANQSTTYIKTENGQLISQIDTGHIDLTDYYYKTKTDELL